MSLQLNRSADASDADLLKMRQQAAIHALEQLNLRDYFFRVLRYAQKKDIPPPHIEFNLNGQLFCKLLVEEVEDDSEDEPALSLEYVLMIFCDQDDLQTECLCGNENVLEERECSINPKIFDALIDDDDAKSGLCYAASFRPVSRDTLDHIFSVVCDSFNKLFNRAKDSAEFFRHMEDTIEWVCYQTCRDAQSAAYEVKAIEPEESAEDDEIRLDQEPNDAEELKEFRETFKQLEETSVADNSLVVSTQLQASIWQFNEKYGITSVSRQYEGLQKLENIGDAKHVPFRGAADDLQKNIHIAHFLVRMIYAMCTNYKTKIE